MRRTGARIRCGNFGSDLRCDVANDLAVNRHCSLPRKIPRIRSVYRQASQHHEQLNDLV